MSLLLQPHLQNEWVSLRPLEVGDFDPLYQVASDPLIWEQHPCQTRYQRGEFEQFFGESLESKGALVVVENEKDQVIGSSRFKLIEEDDTAWEIGWSFLERKYWGGTYNRAVKSLMIEYAFQFVPYVVFYIGPQNLRSQSAVLKLGAVQVQDPEAYDFSRHRKSDLTFFLKREIWMG